MPIYEYQCETCEHTLDALQKVGDAPLVDCPQCGRPGLRRALSAPGFRLKGTGWYETDFKKKNQRNLLQGDGKPEKKSDDKGVKSSSDSGEAASPKKQKPGKPDG